MKKAIITTSWDDGAEEDLRILNLLNKYGLRGTFYIPENINLEIEKGRFVHRLSDVDIINISKTQEIGAHTLNHVYLDRVSYVVAKEEIIESKKWLENLIKKSIQMFAFPGGVHTPESITVVKQTGFIGARETKLFQTNIIDPLLMGISVRLGPVFFLPKDWSLGYKIKVLIRRIRKNIKGIVKLGLPINSLFGWKNLVKNTFDYVVKNGGVFHLYGHSWEIGRHNLWEEAEEIFKYISNRNNIEYLTNSETIKRNENSFSS